MLIPSVFAFILENFCELERKGREARRVREICCFGRGVEVGRQVLKGFGFLKMVSITANQTRDVVFIGKRSLDRRSRSRSR